jgi:hypothetical protein
MNVDFTVKNEKPVFLTEWEPSGWTCYLFGNRPGGMGLVYKPSKGSVPNWFVRWMMRVTLDYLWVKEEKK